MKKCRVSFPVLALGVSLAGFALFYLIPFLVSARYAFVDNPVQKNFVGMKNFTALFQNEYFLLGLRNTAVFMSAAIPLSMGCSLLLALAIRRLGRFGGVFAVIFLIPLVLPSAATVNFWGRLFAENGVLNSLLVRLGMNGQDWLQSGYAMGVMVLLFVWKNAGYNAVLFLTGLSGIPKVYYQCAAVFGATKRQQFFHITMVYLIPSFFLVFLMSFVNSFKIFREVYLLQGSFPHESIYLLQHFVNSTLLSMHYHRLVSSVYVLTLGIGAIVSVAFRMEYRMAENLKGEG